MLRRNPTALTISPEDLQTFEDVHARKLALARYKKTGEDPNGWFGAAAAAAAARDTQRHAQTPMQRGENKLVDPNDELKPLPGDKARIVRGREERIMGTATGTGMGGAR